MCWCIYPQKWEGLYEAKNRAKELITMGAFGPLCDCPTMGLTQRERDAIIDLVPARPREREKKTLLMAMVDSESQRCCGYATSGEHEQFTLSTKRFFFYLLSETVRLIFSGVRALPRYTIEAFDGNKCLTALF